MNTATGYQALFTNTGSTGSVYTGSGNTATGYQALFKNTTGNLNTATGIGALGQNNTGTWNTANGSYALDLNTTGYDNTASGYQALYSNTGGIQNTATGAQALYKNTSANENTADGFQALFNNVGGGNTAVGDGALVSNTSGGDNTAVGLGALTSNKTGNINTAIGSTALLNNTFTDNIAVGFRAGQNLTTGAYNIDIGNDGMAGESGTIRIGTSQIATFIAGISGTGISGIPVKINSSGQLGVVPSSSRFKDEIKPMDKASEAILALRPVTFRYKPEVDPERAPQFGLVAEEVQKVNPALVTRDAQGKVYTVRYEAVNAMLLNEFLKQHREVQEQRKQIEKLTAELKEQAAHIRRVSDKVELNEPTEQIVENDQ